MMARDLGEERVGEIRHDDSDILRQAAVLVHREEYSAGNRNASSAASMRSRVFGRTLAGSLKYSRHGRTGQPAQRGELFHVPDLLLAHDMAPSRCCGRGGPFGPDRTPEDPQNMTRVKFFSCISRAGPVGFGHLRDRRATSHMPSRCGRPRWARDAGGSSPCISASTSARSAVKNLRHRHRRRGRGDRIGATHRPDPVQRSERTGPGVLVGGDPRGHRRTARRRCGAQVRAIGLSGQMHGAVLLDADHQPVRPAILWNDARAAAECADMLAAEPRIGEISGVLPMPGFTAPKLLWLLRHEPDAHGRVASVLLPKDYIGSPAPWPDGDGPVGRGRNLVVRRAHAPLVRRALAASARPTSTGCRSCATEPRSRAS